MLLAIVSGHHEVHLHEIVAARLLRQGAFHVLQSVDLLLAFGDCAIDIVQLRFYRANRPGARQCGLGFNTGLANANDFGHPLFRNVGWWLLSLLLDSFSAYVMPQAQVVGMRRPAVLTFNDALTEWAFGGSLFSLCCSGK